MAQELETLHFLDYWRVLRSRKEVVISVGLIVAVIGILFTFSLPKEYLGSVIIQVKEESPDIPLFTRELSRRDLIFIRTQAEIIQAGPVLKEAIRNLNLAEELAKAYGYYGEPEDKVFEKTYEILSKRMRVRQYRDTDLIEIQVRLSEPKGKAHVVCAELANMIATVYRDQNARRSKELIDRAMKSVEESLEKARRDVEEAEKKLDLIRQRYKIIVGNPRAGADTSIETLSLTKLIEARINAYLDLVEKKTRYEKVRNLTIDQMAEFLRVVQDPVLANLVAEKRAQEIERQAMLETLGENHPDVRKISRAIAEREARIEQQFNGLKASILSDYETAQAKLTQLELMLEQKKVTEVSSDVSGYLEFNRAMDELERLKKLRDDLELTYATKKAELKIPRTVVQVVKPAIPPDVDDPVSPNIPLNIILSIIAGLACGIGLGFFVEYLDTSIKTISDIENYLGVPVLGVIPQHVKPLTSPGADQAHGEAYRVLRANIRFSNKFQGCKTLCITSGSIGEGKSLTAFNLACVSAMQGDRVLLVDADLRRPKQHRMMNLPRSLGLANLLLGEVTLRDVIITSNVTNLDFLPSGRTKTVTHGLLDTVTLKKFVSEIQEKYDLIIFDAPPIIGVSDTSILIREISGVLLVIQYRKYPRFVASRAKDMILNLGGNLIGVVLNNISISRDYTYYYYYQHYYAYPQRSHST
jgi:capsular exopolysaccharide synthesis family protein